MVEVPRGDCYGFVGIEINQKFDNELKTSTEDGIWRQRL